MKKIFLLILFLLCIDFVILNSVDVESRNKLETRKLMSNGPVRISGRDLLTDFDNDGVYDEFKIKGVGYNAVPIGQNPDWGYILFNDPQIVNMANRDFSFLRDMNANTIRTWSKANNIGFLNAAYNNNNKPIRIIMGYWIDPTYSPIYPGQNVNYNDNATRQYYINDFRNYVASYKNHPSVLMWVLGNENNLFYQGNIADFYSLCDEMAQAAYIEEGDDYHPVAIINGNLFNIGNSNVHADDVSLSYVDVWGTNVFPGYSFLDQNYFNQYSPLSSKPLYISEFGIDAWHTNDMQNPGNGYLDEETQTDWDLHSWQELSDCSVCIGGTFMEYSDEWWKANYPLVHDYGGYSTLSWDPIAQPDSFSNEEFWGIISIEDNGSGLDIMHPRLVYYSLQEEFYENYAPFLNPIGNKTGKEAYLLRFNISAYDYNLDHLTFGALNLPFGAQFIDNNDNTATFSWAPLWNQAGSYIIRFEVSDGILVDYENVTITVLNNPMAPIPMMY
ncbi:MAG: glycoside hydrolase family 2 TIM barrel-domain containing protein [archaeon]